MTRIIAILLLITPPAFAQDAMQIAFFERGEYEQAANFAKEAQTADALAFAARALLAEGMCGNGQPPEDLLDSAVKYAEDALALDSDHVEAQLQLAIALSLKARPLSTRAAMRSGYGERGRELAEAAIALDPENPYAHAFMAVWHIEVVRRGGAIGSTVLGASIKQARVHYSRAAKAFPDDASIHWQYARALAALNPKKYRAEIDTSVSRAITVSIDDHLEDVMSKRASQLKSLLQTEPRKNVMRWAEDML